MPDNAYNRISIDAPAIALLAAITAGAWCIGVQPALKARAEREELARQADTRIAELTLAQHEQRQFTESLADAHRVLDNATVQLVSSRRLNERVARSPHSPASTASNSTRSSQARPHPRNSSTSSRYASRDRPHIPRRPHSSPLFTRPTRTPKSPPSDSRPVARGNCPQIRSSSPSCGMPHRPTPRTEFSASGRLPRLRTNWLVGV